MENETHSTEGPKCPHCGHQMTADEAAYYDANLYTKEQCPNCQRMFAVEVDTSTSWTCSPLPGASSSHAA